MVSRRTVGERLAAARVRAKLSQETLAERLGKGQPWISKVEANRIPITVEQTRQIAAIVGVPVRDLMPPDAGPLAPRGFSECIVTPWKPAECPGEVTLPPSAFARDARHPETFAIGHDKAANFGFHRGTILVVDLGATAAEGQLGVTNVVDTETGTAKTVLGRRLGDYLVGPHFAADPGDRTYLDPEQVGAVYPVVGWFSAPTRRTN